MKRIFWKTFLALGVVLSAGLSSCSDSETDKKDPPIPEPPIPDGENTYVTTDCITPLRYTENKYIGDKEGVSIEVTNNGTDNILFTCEPGEEVKAYRVNLYPVASLYNTLLNQLNVETELKEYTVDQVNQLLYQLISNTESETSGGKLMNASALGDDYASYEFDWMNSGYAAFTIKPDAEYLIIVQSYFDAEGTASPGDLCICHVRTPEKALVGNPAIELKIETNYYKYKVTHIPNEDCAGYYYLSSNTAEIQQYIDAYGEKTYMDLLRHYGALVEVSSGNLFFTSGEEKQGVEYCATALAVDVNGTPAKTIARQDFYLRKLPDVTEDGKATVSLPHKLSASVCHFKVLLDMTCARFSYYVHPAAKADEIMAMDEAQRKNLAQLMVDGKGTEAYPGWVLTNPNYGLDPETDQLIGSSYDAICWQHELADDTEYKIVYACRNGYGQATDLMVTEGFTTKKLIKDNPAACTAELTLEITKATRTAFYLKSTYNQDNVARFYYQYYAPLPTEHYPIFDELPGIEDGSDEARLREHGWLYFFLDYRDPAYGFPWPNETVQMFGNGVASVTDFWNGFNPGIEHHFAYMAEDWNGVLGPVKFFKGTTLAINAGENPVVDLTYEKQQSGDYKVQFTANEDTAQLKYMVCKSSNSSDVANLQLTDLLKSDFGGITFEEYKAAWEEYTMANGLTTPSLSASLDISAAEEIAAAVAIPIGADAKGNPVYGEMKTLIYRKSTGELKSLQEYMGVPAAANLSTVLRMNTQKPVRLGPPRTAFGH